MNSEPKVAVITGGKGTLASALAQGLEADGWRVHAPGREALDVTDSTQVNAFFAALPRVDLLVNQAGVIDDTFVIKMNADQFDKVVDVSLTGAFRCARVVLKIMSRQRMGHLIHVGSYAACQGTAGQANYAAAKAGLIGLSKSIALEYGPRNIRSNCVLPGLLETKMTAALLSDQERRKACESKHALGRLNTVNDAAKFMVFLDSMTHVSGQVFQLDSRLSAWT
jgi:NAD(P)-dependent dehydrogenase (short-subunit alcohol dehydrogenase family)